MLLIGLGLNDEKDISLKGLEEAKSCEKIYCETYTSLWRGDLKLLEKLIGKEIKMLERRTLEEFSSKLIEEAKSKKVCILVPGDPLVATTHISLLLEAKKRGIETSVIHSSSIISAVAETGLQIYKFGKTVTIPLPEKTKGKLPISVYDTIKDNKERGLRTLCLLDLDIEKNIFLSVREAIEILLKIEKKRGEGVISESSKLVVCCRLGSKDKQIIYDKISNLKNREFKEPPYVIIIPGNLHFLEKESLELLRNPNQKNYSS